MSKKRFSMAIEEADFYTFKMRAADRNQSIAECFHDLLYPKVSEQPVQPEAIARDGERFAKLEEAIKEHHERLAKLQSAIEKIESSAASVSTAKYEAQSAKIEALEKKCEANLEEFLKLNQDKIAQALTIKEKDAYIAILETTVKDTDTTNQLFNAQRREQKARSDADYWFKRVKDYEAIDPQLPDKLKAKEERAAIERRGMLSRLGDDGEY